MTRDGAVAVLFAITLASGALGYAAGQFVGERSGKAFEESLRSVEVLAEALETKATATHQQIKKRWSDAWDTNSNLPPPAIETLRDHRAFSPVTTAPVGAIEMRTAEHKVIFSERSRFLQGGGEGDAWVSWRVGTTNLGTAPFRGFLQASFVDSQGFLLKRAQAEIFLDASENGYAYGMVRLTAEEMRAISRVVTSVCAYGTPGCQ